MWRWVVGIFSAIAAAGLAVLAVLKIRDRDRTLAEQAEDLARREVKRAKRDAKRKVMESEEAAQAGFDAIQDEVLRDVYAGRNGVARSLIRIREHNRRTKTPDTETD